MKKITIDISDDVFDLLCRYSVQSGKRTEDLASDAVQSGLSLWNFDEASKKTKEHKQQWKKEVGWVDYNRTTVPHPLCR